MNGLLNMLDDIYRQLTHSDKSIKEIANSLDFPNLSFFGKFVRAHLDCSPSGFRRKKGGQEDASEERFAVCENIFCHDKTVRGILS